MLRGRTGKPTCIASNDYKSLGKTMHTLYLNPSVSVSGPRRDGRSAHHAADSKLTNSAHRKVEEVGALSANLFCCLNTTYATARAALATGGCTNMPMTGHLFTPMLCCSQHQRPVMVGNQVWRLFSTLAGERVYKKCCLAPLPCASLQQWLKNGGTREECWQRQCLRKNSCLHYSLDSGSAEDLEFVSESGPIIVCEHEAASDDAATMMTRPVVPRRQHTNNENRPLSP